MVWDPRKCVYILPELNSHSAKINRNLFWVEPVEGTEFGLRAEYNDAEFPLYVLQPTQENNPKGFPIFWCPYTQGQTRHINLNGNDAKFMFTEPMSGCTFALGTRSFNGKTMIVSHSNAHDAADIDEQRQAQYQMAHSLHGNRGIYIEPSSYRNPRQTVSDGGGTTDLAMTFGVYGEMEDGVDRLAQGKRAEGAKYNFLKVKRALWGTKRWRFYRTRLWGGGGFWKVVELAKRLD